MKNYILITLFFACSILRGQVVFRHTTAANNTSGHITNLDHPQLNGNPNAIIFIMPNWNTNGTASTGIDFSYNTGVWYNGKNWTIFNQNTQLTMPLNVTFNILIAPQKDPNVFIHVCTKTNTGGGGGTFANGTIIDNPITNNNPNVLLLVTQNYKGVYNNNTPVVSYGGNKWYISNTISSPNDLGVKLEKNMPIRAAFNIMVINKGQVPGFSNAVGFMHTVTEKNKRGTPNATFIDNPSFKHSPETLLFATNNWGWGSSSTAEQTAGPHNDSPISAWFNTNFTDGNAIYNAQKGVNLPVGAKFNVVAVSQSKPSVFVDTGKLYIRFPGQKTSQLVSITIINGLIIYQGDIILGRAVDYFKKDGSGTFPKDAPANAVGTPIDFRLWQNGVIPFQIANNHPRRLDILEAIRRINTTTNICIRPRTSETDFVEFRYIDSLANSWIGRQGGMQIINIGDRRFNIGSIQHEILHCAGMFHEQSRPDRDDFVRIVWDNIQPNARGNFDREERTLSPCPYDYGSIMHYPTWAFAIDPSRPTIIPTRPVPTGITLGQTTGLSNCDVEGLRFLYPTATGCDPTPPASQLVILYEQPNYGGRSVPFNTNSENANVPFTVRSIRVASGYVAEISSYCNSEFPPPPQSFVNNYSDVTLPDVCKIRIMRILSTQTINIPNITERCPTNHIAGDGEFAGRGPNIECQTSLTQSNGALQLEVTFSAREDGYPVVGNPPANIDKNIDMVRGSWTSTIFTPLAGQRAIIAYNTSTQTLARFRSRPAGDEPGGIVGACNEGQLHLSGRDFNLTGTLVREMQIVGDTGHRDINNNCACDTKIKLIRFNPVNVYLVTQ